MSSSSRLILFRTSVVENASSYSAYSRWTRRLPAVSMRFFRVASPSGSSMPAGAFARRRAMLSLRSVYFFISALSRLAVAICLFIPAASRSSGSSCRSLSPASSALSSLPSLKFASWSCE